MDLQVKEISRNLVMLAQACLNYLDEHRKELNEQTQKKLRGAARAALNRAHELPRLVQRDRAAWLDRTWKFLDAVSRLLVELLELEEDEND